MVIRGCKFFTYYDNITENLSCKIDKIINRRLNILYLTIKEKFYKVVFQVIMRILVAIPIRLTEVIVDPYLATVLVTTLLSKGRWGNKIFSLVIICNVNVIMSLVSQFCPDTSPISRANTLDYPWP